jgi:hypothetical protein
MTIQVSLLLMLLVMHWIADFVLQSHKMASNKSKSNYWLGLHCLVYGILFMIVINPLFGIITGLAHFVTDYFTSRLTSHLWEKKEVHNFFVVIGFDQLIHVTTLVFTFIYFG